VYYGGLRGRVLLNKGARGWKKESLDDVPNSCRSVQSRPGRQNGRIEEGHELKDWEMMARVKDEV